MYNLSEFTLFLYFDVCGLAVTFAASLHISRPAKCPFRGVQLTLITSGTITL